MEKAIDDKRFKTVLSVKKSIGCLTWAIIYTWVRYEKQIGKEGKVRLICPLPMAQCLSHISVQRANAPADIAYGVCLLMV